MNIFLRRSCCAALLVCVSLRAQCPGGWQPGFGATSSSPTDVVFASVVFDDGTGPHLYASGKFGGLGAGGPVVAVHSAGSWVQVGANAEVRAFAIWDNGTGPALYAAGDWPVGPAHLYAVRRLIGSTWSPVGPGLTGLPTALTVFDPDGPGPGAATLYVAGSFGVQALTGTAWTTIGTGDVRSLCVYDADGAGPGLAVLVAGGAWWTMGAATSKSIAAWNGQAWTSMGTGMDSPIVIPPNPPYPGTVAALRVHDSGSGPILYAGGFFVAAGGVVAYNLAAWNGTAWFSIGDISPLQSFTGSVVASLGVFDDGSGPRLYVGGTFTHAGGVPAANVASWGPGGWSALGTGVSFGYPFSTAVFSLTSFDADGAGPVPAVLVATGAFNVTGGLAADGAATWNGSSWTPLGVPTTLDNGVFSLAVFDDGTGPALYAAGRFIVAASVVANRIARFDGTSWTALGPGMNGPVYALLVHDDGTGPQLYAGGLFTPAPGQPGSGIARWNGTSWSAVGGGVTGGSSPAVCALAVHDDGTGPKLFAGGRFTTAGGVAASGIARWDGVSWSALGSGVVPPPTVWAGGLPGWINALVSFDADGAGPLPPQLCAGGRFDVIGGIAAFNVASWNGLSWNNMGPGFGLSGGSPVGGTVYSLVASGVEGPPKLFACGYFDSSGTTVLGGIARWSGSAWSSVGGGLGPVLPPAARGSGLATWDDGGGESLYVAGYFASAGNTPASNIARWKGGTWSALGTGLNSAGVCFAALPPGLGLCVGGNFSTAGGMSSVFLARWLPGHGVSIVQPGGPGTGVFVSDANLQASLEYYNIFSTQPCGAPGSGPYFGLCATNVLTLLDQFLLPVGSLPFHFVATSPTAVFGPFPVPPGITLDGICLTTSLGGFCPSPVSRLTVQ